MSYKSVPALGKDWLTPLFDVLLAVVGLGAPLTERVIERVHIQDGEHLLDVGCGTATLLIVVKSRYPSAQVVGADTDERALAIAHTERGGVSALPRSSASSAFSVPLDDFAQFLKHLVSRNHER